MICNSIHLSMVLDYTEVIIQQRKLILHRLGHWLDYFSFSQRSQNPIVDSQDPILDFSHMQHHQEIQWTTAKSILGYLKETINWDIYFKQHGGLMYCTFDDLE